MAGKRARIGLAGWGAVAFCIGMAGLNAYRMVEAGEPGAWAFVLIVVASVPMAVSNQIRRSERLRDGLRCLAIALLIVAAAMAALSGVWLNVAMAVAIAGLFTWVSLRDRGEVRSTVVESEGLVGLTVAQAQRRLGFGEDREPGGLELAPLVPMPEGAVDLTAAEVVDADLIVSAVTIDDREWTVTFGVATPEEPLTAQIRADLQRRLEERTGGRPGDVQPLAKPDPMAKYRPRL